MSPTDVRPLSDIPTQQIRDWAQQEITQSVTAAIKQYRDVALRNLIHGSQSGAGDVALRTAGGQIQALDAVIDWMEGK
jgi:hypothetical protein